MRTKTAERLRKRLNQSEASGKELTRQLENAAFQNTALQSRNREIERNNNELQRVLVNTGSAYDVLSTDCLHGIQNDEDMQEFARNFPSLNAYLRSAIQNSETLCYGKISSTPDLLGNMETPKAFYKDERSAEVNHTTAVDSRGVSQNMQN